MGEIAQRGFLVIDDRFRESIGDKELNNLFKFIEFETYGAHHNKSLAIDEYYGYCPLFKPLLAEEKTPTYTMKVDFSGPDPVVEMFERYDE